MTNEMHEPMGDSRRNFMKKGALAATALAVGAGATATTGSVAAQEEEEEGEVVIHGGDYYPGEEFLVLAELETGSKDDLLEHLDEDEEEFDDHGDWDVYPIRIEVGGPGGRLGYIMVENDEVEAEPGDTGTMGETASFRSSELNLMELDVTLEAVDEEEDDEEVDDEEVDDEEVDEEEEVEDEPEDEEEEENDDGF
ncbi:calcium-binding protein [Natronobeatus ordinarius]|uniref:calcium-binding protein n=1 Tax=Natronobeatus ordinarius TaxID=2963433 RepID=UPI0020CEC102|nr:calcium-binding protein [Natronobeatus ordinarius]